VALHRGLRSLAADPVVQSLARSGATENGLAALKGKDQ
jgi:hypothetical protein